MGIFSRRPKLDSTGHDGDDAVLRMLAKRGSLDAPRHWLHYIYADRETTAITVRDAVLATGEWKARVAAPVPDEIDEWSVTVERDDAIVTPATVIAARAFFEGLVAAHRGAEYDGWEASA